jgi:hypothetical protein
MTATLVARAYAPQASGVEPRDDVLTRALAAIKRAPMGPPLTDAERERVAENDRAGQWSSAEEFMAKLAQHPSAAQNDDDDE